MESREYGISTPGSDGEYGGQVRKEQYSDDRMDGHDSVSYTHLEEEEYFWGKEADRMHSAVHKTNSRKLLVLGILVAAAARCV